MTPPLALRERLYVAIADVARYRQHITGCEINQTDFCTCGLREAMDHLNVTWRDAADALSLTSQEKKTE